MSLFDKTIYECALYAIDDTMEYNPNLSLKENVENGIKDNKYNLEMQPIMLERASLVDYKKFKEILTGIEIPSYTVTMLQKNGASPTVELSYPNTACFVLVVDDRINKTLSIEKVSDDHLKQYKLEHQDIDVYRRQLEVTVEAAKARFMTQTSYQKKLK